MLRKERQLTRKELRAQKKTEKKERRARHHLWKTGKQPAQQSTEHQLTKSTKRTKRTVEQPQKPSSKRVRFNADVKDNQQSKQAAPVQQETEDMEALLEKRLMESLSKKLGIKSREDENRILKEDGLDCMATSDILSG